MEELREDMNNREIENKEEKEAQLLKEMEQSSENDCSGFFLVYQPQIKVESYQLFGAEALLRYHSSVFGQVMPGDFIPLLEQTGLISTVGMWVLKKALAQCREWRVKMPDFHISVNISYVQLTQPDIRESVLNVLKESGLPGSALTLEVTESMQLQDFQYFNEIFSEWKQEGIEISVDDFGTGYSSLGYLKYLKIDEIKIDRCFVSGIQDSGYNYKLLKNILELTDSAHIRACCEGVEEKEELQVLEELKPELAQGYLFSKPCDSTLFERRYFDETDTEYQTYWKHIAQVKKKHYGSLLNLRHRDILKSTNLGVWIICVDKETNEKEMYADETMLQVMGADRSLTPKECFQFWYDHIRKDCLSYVKESVERMISSYELEQIQYMWLHPKDGEVEVRCTGIRTKEDIDGMICLQGYHRVISNIERTWFNSNHTKEEEQ